MVHTDQIFFFHGKVHHSSYLQFIFLGSGRRLFRAGGLFAVGKLLADRWPGLANTHITALIFVNHSNTDGNTEFYYEEKGRRSEAAIGS